MAWRGIARHGKAGVVRHGMARRSEARQGIAGKAWQAWLGMVWRGVAKQGKAGLARHGTDRQGGTRQGTAGMDGCGGARHCMARRGAAERCRNG